MGRKPVHPGTPSAQLNRAPVVGRQAELSALANCLATASQGQGGVVTIAGEPGIGKTRLLQELAERARASGWLVLAGRADESEGLPPYLPFREALWGYLRAFGPEELVARLGPNLNAVSLLVPELLERVTERPAPPAPLGPDEARYRLFESISTVLLDLANERAGAGVLLELDDLQWADAPTLQLLHHLARRLTDAPVLIAGAYRTVDLDRRHPLQALLANLSRERTSQRVQLGALSQLEAAQLIGQTAGVPPAAAIVHAIYSESDGNPFFLREVVQQLVAEGRDLTDPRAAVERWRIPEGVRQVLGQRLARLGVETVRALDVAAVLGDGLSFEVWQRASGLEEPALLDAIDEALSAGMLREDGDGYAFSHALIRQTVEAQLSLPRKQRLHMRSAEAIEAIYPGNEARRAAALAAHYRLAGAAADPEKAIGYAVLAGDEALAAFAYETAVTRWQAALQLLEERDEASTIEQRAELLVRLGRTLLIGSVDLSRGIACLERAVELYEKRGATELAAGVHAELGRARSTFWEAYDLPRALEHFQTARSLMAHSPETSAVGYVHAGLAFVAGLSMRCKEALDAGAQALAVAERVGDTVLAAHARTHYGMRLFASGHPVHGLTLLDRAWGEALRLNDPMLPFTIA